MKAAGENRPLFALKPPLDKGRCLAEAEGIKTPVAVPDKIFGLTLSLDFIDRCHSLRSLYLPLGSAPIAPPQSATLTAPPSQGEPLLCFILQKIF